MMPTERALLPSGFYDLLPPDAAFEAALTQQVMAQCEGFGYLRVRPPLLEFEDSLLANAGTEVRRQTFRVMDPLSQKLMGIRADMTMQIGRIAVTRLKEMPAPLRLSYTGTTLHTRADTLAPDRQITQAGAELIGSDTPEADVEVILLAASCLKALGVSQLSIDVNVPSLAPLLLQDLGVERTEQEAILQALTNKDLTALSRLNPPLGDVLADLVRSMGPAKEVLPKLQALDLPPACSALRERLSTVIEKLLPLLPEVEVTLDVTENRGFDYYHTGISFALFAKGSDHEIGRGGRYKVAFDQKTPATGFTLYIGDLLTLLQPPLAKTRLYLPLDTPYSMDAPLREKGYATVRGLQNCNDVAAEAARLECQAYWVNGKIMEIPS